MEDDASYKELISWYLEKEKETIVSLQEALTKQDYSKLVYIADMLYGHGGTYGFSFISFIGKSIEQAAISKDDKLISSLISELNNYLELISKKN